MLTRSRLRAVLRAIAAGVPLIGASCGCPKATRETIATYQGTRLPQGAYSLHGCEDASGEVRCRYEHTDNQLHAVIQVVRCDEVCGVDDRCYGDAHDVVCVHEDEQTFEQTEVRVAMPAQLERPEDYGGRCTERGEFACDYASNRAVGKTAYLESLAGYGPTLQEGNDSYGCDVDHQTSEITCWHGKYLKCHAGRRPDGEVASTCDRDPQLVLEAASVPAFEALAAELRVHGAPAALARAARRAMTDELRHAGIVAALGGAGAVEIRVERREPRDLFAVALDNAREGCAGEALAAIAAQVVAGQAHGAARAALASIARDEAGHALLSFAIDDWARARLGARATRVLDDAHREALHAAVA